MERNSTIPTASHYSASKQFITVLCTTIFVLRQSRIKEESRKFE